MFETIYMKFDNFRIEISARAHASHRRHLSSESAPSPRARWEECALCTFFSLLPQASLHCCGLMVSSPGPCASSGGRLPEAFFLVFRLESQGAEVCKSSLFHFRFRFFSPKRRIRVNLVDLVKSFQASIYLQISASIQPRMSLSKFAKN